MAENVGGNQNFQATPPTQTKVKANPLVLMAVGTLSIATILSAIVLSVSFRMAVTPSTPVGLTCNQYCASIGVAAYGCGSFDPFASPYDYCKNYQPAGKGYLCYPDNKCYVDINCATAADVENISGGTHTLTECPNQHCICANNSPQTCTFSLTDMSNSDKACKPPVISVSQIYTITPYKDNMINVSGIEPWLEPGQEIYWDITVFMDDADEDVVPGLITASGFEELAGVVEIKPAHYGVILSLDTTNPALRQQIPYLNYVVSVNDNVYDYQGMQAGQPQLNLLGTTSEIAAQAAANPIQIIVASDYVAQNPGVVTQPPQAQSGDGSNQERTLPCFRSTNFETRDRSKKYYPFKVEETEEADGTRTRTETRQGWSCIAGGPRLMWLVREISTTYPVDNPYSDPYRIVESWETEGVEYEYLEKVDYFDLPAIVPNIEPTYRLKCFKSYPTNKGYITSKQTAAALGMYSIEESLETITMDGAALCRMSDTVIAAFTVNAFYIDYIGVNLSQEKRSETKWLNGQVVFNLTDNRTAYQLVPLLPFWFPDEPCWTGWGPNPLDIDNHFNLDTKADFECVPY